MVQWSRQDTKLTAYHPNQPLFPAVVHVANLDPAAENFKYDVAFDIRDLITVEDVMEELGLGPNGALIYCMEYLIQNMDWLEDNLEKFDDDEYLLLDCEYFITLICIIISLQCLFIFILMCRFLI